MEKEARFVASFCVDKLKSMMFSALCRFFDILYRVLTICAGRAIVNDGCNNFVIIYMVDVTFVVIDGGENA